MAKVSAGYICSWNPRRPQLNAIAASTSSTLYRTPTVAMAVAQGYPHDNGPA